MKHLGQQLNVQNTYYTPGMVPPLDLETSESTLYGTSVSNSNEKVGPADKRRINVSQVEAFVAELLAREREQKR